MSVQALDAHAGTADPSRRTRSDMICWNRCVSFGRVRGMCTSDVDRIEIGFRLADAADCFDTTHGPHQVSANEVVPGGHRCAVTE